MAHLFERIQIRSVRFWKRYPAAEFFHHGLAKVRAVTNSLVALKDGTGEGQAGLGATLPAIGFGQHLENGHCVVDFHVSPPLKAEKLPGFLGQQLFILSVRVAFATGEMITVPAIFNLPALRAAMYRAVMTVSKKMLLKRYLPGLAPTPLALDGFDGNTENCRPLLPLFPGG
jgi:hypothetical protein